MFAGELLSGGGEVAGGKKLGKLPASDPVPPGCKGPFPLNKVPVWNPPNPTGLKPVGCVCSNPNPLALALKVGELKVEGCVCKPPKPPKPPMG